MNDLVSPDPIVFY